MGALASLLGCGWFGSYGPFGQVLLVGGSEKVELLWLMSGKRAGENRYNSWVTLLGKLSQCIKHRLISHRGTGDTQPSSQRILYVSLEQPTS